MIIAINPRTLQSIADQLSERLGRRDGQLDLEGYIAAEREKALARRKRAP